jgi:two-component system, cell cycle sensor histidine kinase and response regulator CckA
MLDYPGAASFVEGIALLSMTGSSQRGPATILLAEDEALLRELGETILRNAGYTVISVHRREELDSLLKSHTTDIDVLLTDVVMPEISGQELAKRVRSRWPGVRVIYTSGYPGDELKDMHRDATFLQKPFTPAELMEKIRQALANS